MHPAREAYDLQKARVAELEHEYSHTLPVLQKLEYMDLQLVLSTTDYTKSLARCQHQQEHLTDTKRDPGQLQEAELTREKTRNALLRLEEEIAHRLQTHGLTRNDIDLTRTRRLALESAQILLSQLKEVLTDVEDDLGYEESLKRLRHQTIQRLGPGIYVDPQPLPSLSHRLTYPRGW